MKAGDRVTGRVALPCKRGEELVLVEDVGTVLTAYEGMVTSTPYALVRWDRQGLHCHQQAELTPAVAS